MISSSDINIPGPCDQEGDEEEKEEAETVMVIPQTGRARTRTRNRAQPGLRRVAPTLPPASTGTVHQMDRILPNGDFYTGSFLGKAPHGPGKYLWSDGCMYEGEWRRGKADGKGRFSWPSGATYEGEFKAGKMDGYGTFTGTDGDTYKGMWSADKKHGDGEKRYANGDFYQGSWKNNLQDGEGRYVWSNGNVYVGDWRAGVISGKGILIWTNGNRYEGYWENGVPRGAGVFTRADGSTYAGNWGNGIVENNENVNGGRGEEEGEGVSKKGLSADAVGMCSTSERGVNFPRICIWEDNEEGGDTTCDIIDNVEVSKLGKDAINNPPRGGYRNRLGFGARRQRNCQSQSPSPRPYWLGDSDEIKKPGQTISKGHKNYELMLNLQLGIRHSVGKHGSKGRALKPSDFDPREKYWTRFPPEGSRSTPPHQSVDFRWKDYCPMVFRHLRELFEIDQADYMLAICGNDALRGFSSPGKSGSSFYLTQDDRFMIKTVKKSDVKVLIKMLPSYYRHVSKYKNTLVTKFFGLHCVKPIGGQKTRFIVMGNLFHSEYRIHRRFDIKGSSHGRSTDKNEREIDETTTLKDLDLNMVFRLQHSWFEQLMRQVDRDCEFLEAEKIMDYSLLIGLHFCDDLSNDASVSSCTGSGNHEELPDAEGRPPPPIRLGANMQARAERVVRIDFVDQQQLQLQGSCVRSSNNNNNNSSNGTPRRQGEGEGKVKGSGTVTVRKSGTTPPARSSSSSSGTSLVRYNSDGYREVYNVILHFGIIDILQDYDISKRIEHAYKSLQADPTSISAVDPKLYSKRFRDFLHKIFMED